MSDTLYYEDFPVGLVLPLGSHFVSEAEIITFARQFDPQPFHVDPDAARHSPYGGVIASGWHTASIVMRLMVDGYLLRSAAFGSPGMDSVRWLAPVRPGDILTARSTIIEARESESRPDRGVISVRSEAYNQDDAIVLSMQGIMIVAKRPPR